MQAVPSWFVKVTAIKDRLVANNTLTDWVPSYVKEKRFHNWLKVGITPPHKDLLQVRGAGRRNSSPTQTRSP
jgi:tRNA synthetases class I (I, L, M and V)